MREYEFIRVLVILRDDWVVAQCLEVDISTQALTIPDLFEDLHRILNAYRVAKTQLGVGLEDLPEAPAHFEELWQKAPPLGEGLPWFPIPPGEHSPQAKVRLASAERQ